MEQLCLIDLQKPEHLQGVINNHNRIQSDAGKAIYKRRKLIEAN